MIEPEILTGPVVPVEPSLGSSGSPEASTFGGGLDEVIHGGPVTGRVNQALGKDGTLACSKSCKRGWLCRPERKGIEMLPMDWVPSNKSKITSMVPPQALAAQ